jgi:hypothetical protein
MVLYLVHVVSGRIRGMTLPQVSFTATCFGLVLCPAIIIELSMKKKGLYWKTIKKKKKKKKMMMMIRTIMSSLNTVVLQWRRMKKRHQMIPLMILVAPLRDYESERRE